jgi:putative ATP-binding cassette transporter
MMSLPWRRLWNVAKPFWRSEKKWVGLALFALVLLCMFANVRLAVFANTQAGNFMTSIEQRSTDNFYHYLWMWTGALAAQVPVQVFYAYFRTWLALVWRKWLTESLMGRYYSNRAYYKMLRITDIDNPDQRMTQDVDSFCNTSVGLFIAVLDAVVNVATFATVLYALSPMLTWTVFGYAAAGSVLMMLVGRSLPKINFEQSKTEADLRFSLAEARREAESIALYGAEPVVMSQSRARLGDVIDTLMWLMRTWRNIGFFTTPYNMLVALIPLVMMAGPYFAHHIAFGQITQATMAFGAVFGGATFLVNQFGGISGYTATINRLGSFMEALETAGIESLPPEKRIEVVEGASIRFDHVSILTPDLARPLIFDLSVEVKPSQSLLVTGPDGSGKSALARVIAGLWNAGSGKLTRPTSAQVMFMTPLPYLPTMTLRQALCFSDGTLCHDDSRLLQVLSLVGLPDLVVRAGALDDEHNWRQMLSLSEQQRLSLARVILRKPQYVVIDEATSALEPAQVDMLYTLLASLGSTVVTCGNGSNLTKYHTNVLELAGDGTWKLHTAKEYKPKPFANRFGSGFLPPRLRGKDDE